MDEKTLVQEESQIFLFGFSARELYEEFEGLVHYYLNETIKVMKEEIDELHLSKNVPIDTIKDFYKQDCKSRLKEFKETAKEMFHVPDDVELPLPEMVQGHVTDEELDKEEYDIEQLQEQLMQARVYQAALEQKKNLMTNCVEPTFAVIDACIKARKRIKNKSVAGDYINFINKFVNDLRKGDTVEKDYNGSAEKVNFYDDKDVIKCD